MLGCLCDRVAMDKVEYTVAMVDPLHRAMDSSMGEGHRSSTGMALPLSRTCMGCRAMGAVPQPLPTLHHQQDHPLG